MCGESGTKQEQKTNQADTHCQTSDQDNHQDASFGTLFLLTWMQSRLDRRCLPCLSKGNICLDCGRSGLLRCIPGLLRGQTWFSRWQDKCILACFIWRRLLWQCGSLWLDQR